MKIQRDNTKVALTQEMKDEVFEKEKEKIRKAELDLENKIKKDEELKKIHAEGDAAFKEYSEIVEPIGVRQSAYPPIQVQLDMLWHDMDNGTIKVNKRTKDSWYKLIKTIKSNVPISTTWYEDSLKAQEKIEKARIRYANTNMQGV